MDEASVRLRGFPIPPDNIPRAIAVSAGIILVVLAVVASLHYLKVPFWPPGQSTVFAAGGCLDIDVERATTRPRTTLETAVADSRAQLEERGVATSDPDEALPFMGDVHWSMHGHWSGEGSVPRWIIVFQNRRDKEWLYRNLIRNPEDRVTVIYMHGRSEVVDYCTRRHPWSPR